MLQVRRNRALEAPLRQISDNAGVEGSLVVQKVSEGEGAFGFNARTEDYEDLVKAGVIDPAKVVRVALEHAASVEGMLLTTECVNSDIPEENPAMPPMGGGGGILLITFCHYRVGKSNDHVTNTVSTQ